MKQRPDPLHVTSQHLSRAQRWPIGQAVTVTTDDGASFETVTCSAPWRCKGPWVIRVEGLWAATPLARIVERP